MRVFVDSSYYLARVLPRDQWHAAAVKASTTGMSFYVFDGGQRNDLTTAIKSYLSAALTFLERMRLNEEVQVIYPDAALQAEAWDFFSRWAGSGASVIDCVSFAIMRRMGIRKAFTFDAHFRAPGFDTLGAAKK